MKGYAPRAPHFEKNALPFRPGPRKDELFSSWVCNIASGYGGKLQSFCHILWPQTAIWNRDVDRSASEQLLASVAAMTMTPLTAARQTLLRGLEGTLFRKFVPNGNTKWIMPLGVYHRRRRRPGLQYCPQCLSAETRLWRRSWRLSFITVCDVHDCALRDRCPHCACPIHAHRGEMGDRRSLAIVPASLCTLCRGELTQHIAECQPSTEAISFQASLIHRLTGDGKDLEYFEVLAHLASLLSSQRERLFAFRSFVAHSSNPRLPLPRTSDEQISCLFDAMELLDRQRILGMLAWLVVDWPDRLIDCAKSTQVRASDLSRDFQSAPAWYLQDTEPLSDARRRSHSAWSAKL